MTIHDFQDRTAIVTGASGGVGRATLELLLQGGARVIAQDINEAVHDLAEQHPDQVISIVGDVADENVADRAVQTAMDRFGRLDVLVNNAGRTLNKPLIKTSTQDWDTIMTVNARGAFVQTRAALRVMQQARTGSIVTVASYAATVALPEGSAYSASKGAISQLMKVAAIESAPYGVRCNAVAPAVIDTGFLNTIRPDGQEYLRTFADAHPLGRIAQPTEIAEAILFLASDAASFITGALLPVDGGFTAL